MDNPPVDAGTGHEAVYLSLKRTASQLDSEPTTPSGLCYDSPDDSEPNVTTSEGVVTDPPHTPNGDSDEPPKKKGKRSEKKIARDAKRVRRRKKENLAARAAERAKRLTSNTAPSNPRIFADAAVVQTEMHLDLVLQQQTASLPPTTTHTCQSQSTSSTKLQQGCTGKHELHEDCDPEVLRLMEEGYTYIKNDRRKAQIVADCNDRIFFVKVKPPGNSDEAVEHVREIIEEICKRASEANDGEISSEECLQIILELVLPQGTLGPQSQTIPAFLRPFVDELLVNPWIEKYMHHVTRCFRVWFPRHAFVYEEVKSRLNLDKDLSHDISPRSPFCGTTINLGPHDTTIIRHCDNRSLVGGLSMIGVFGHFNHETSGHLIMEEAKVIIELRHGDVVFTPLTAITHKNVQLRAGESCSSIVQYTAGCFFRWIWQGKETLPESEMKLNPGFCAAGEGVRCWKEMYELFPTLEELLVAKEHGLMSLGDIEEKIKTSRSSLFP